VRLYILRGAFIDYALREALVDFCVRNPLARYHTTGKVETEREGGE
jgi:hypothetical protein